MTFTWWPKFSSNSEELTTSGWLSAAFLTASLRIYSDRYENRIQHSCHDLREDGVHVCNQTDVPLSYSGCPYFNPHLNFTCTLLSQNTLQIQQFIVLSQDWNLSSLSFIFSSNQRNHKERFMKFSYESWKIPSLNASCQYAPNSTKSAPNKVFSKTQWLTSLIQLLRIKSLCLGAIL